MKWRKTNLMRVKISCRGVNSVAVEAIFYQETHFVGNANYKTIALQMKDINHFLGENACVRNGAFRYSRTIAPFNSVTAV